MTLAFFKIVQRPGQMVILHASSAHFGFNCGDNIAQAINVATIDWIPWGINAKKCHCLYVCVLLMKHF